MLNIRPSGTVYLQIKIFCLPFTSSWKQQLFFLSFIFFHSSERFFPILNQIFNRKVVLGSLIFRCFLSPLVVSLPPFSFSREDWWEFPQGRLFVLADSCPHFITATVIHFQPSTVLEIYTDAFFPSVGKKDSQSTCIKLNSQSVSLWFELKLSI